MAAGIQLPTPITEPQPERFHWTKRYTDFYKLNLSVFSVFSYDNIKIRSYKVATFVICTFCINTQIVVVIRHQGVQTKKTGSNLSLPVVADNEFHSFISQSQTSIQ